jgi:sugar phosphate isomerase/epimerase
METLPLALTAYGLPHVMGWLPTKAGERPSAPLGWRGLLDTARDLGLAGVEMPLPPPQEAPPEAVCEALAERGLRLVADYRAVLDADAQTFRDYLRASSEAGAKVVRTVLSGVLCGDRRALPGGWDSHLAVAAQRLREVLPLAEDLGLRVAVENHQDATTDDFLRLAEMVGHSPAYGVTLDTGNPLAVGEEPVEAARRLAPLIRHLHLKDYTIHFAPEGYRLARCAAGDGAVDFRAILDIVLRTGRDLLPGIEIGAQATRTIPMLEPGWWACYPPRPATTLLPALRLLWTQGRPADEPYSSAWERGEDSSSVCAEEWEAVRRSMAFFRRLYR